MIFKGPKVAFQNIIFKEYLNVVPVHENGQNYEITLFFLVVLLMFISIFGYGSGSETLELRIRLRIRIRQKFRILADPDTQH
jgi:hypothetical protein